MIFSVIISEKGGAERRESFDRTEINVGRVQGNDLMLPKGNVSKRHARLLYRDGRFIVTDLKSTNGTYVNGRKIAQATIVREGDKIYIGDFVLRIEASQSATGSRAPSGDYTSAAADAGSIDAPLSSPPGPSSMAPGARGTRAEIHTGEHVAVDVVSHFPLEQDPDEAPPPVPVPGPPRIPRPAAATKPSASLLPPGTTSMPPSPPIGAPMPPMGGTSRPTASSIPAPPHSPFPPAAIAPKRAIQPPPTIDRTGSEPGTGPPGAHRNALAALIERVGESVDLEVLSSGAPLDTSTSARIAAAINERAAAMKVAGQIPDGLTHDGLATDARRELLELGPLGPLLADEDVTEIQLLRHDHVIAFRKSRRHATAEISFTSEESVARVLRRLCRSAGAPLAEGETVVERRLPEGPRLLALLPPASPKGHMVVLRKPQRAEPSTLEDLVRSGALSRAIATLLLHCMAGRANVLVVGPQGSGASSLVAALAGTFGGDERVVLLQDDEDLSLNHPHALPVQVGAASADASALVRAATRMRPDRLVVGSMSGAITAEIIDAIGEGAGGIVAASRAPTLRHAAARLTSDLAAARPGAGAHAAREALASAFDLLIEISRLRDGRQRILRVAELRVEEGALVPRDIFTFTVERTAAGGAIEGSFHPTGAVPAIVEDLAARGSPLDASIFRRPGK